MNVQNVVRMWKGNLGQRNIRGVIDGVHQVQLHHPQEKRYPF